MLEGEDALVDQQRKAVGIFAMHRVGGGEQRGDRRLINGVVNQVAAAEAGRGQDRRIAGFQANR